jgi:hypothetical protein
MEDTEYARGFKAGWDEAIRVSQAINNTAPFDPEKKYTNHLSVLVDAVGGEGMKRVKAFLDLTGYAIYKESPPHS